MELASKSWGTVTRNESLLAGVVSGQLSRLVLADAESVTRSLVQGIQSSPLRRTNDVVTVGTNDGGF